MPYIEFVALITFLGCLFVYFSILKISIEYPELGIRGRLNVYYNHWVKGLEHHEDTIVAIQTMRNVIISVTFLTSAMLVLLGLVIDLFNIDEITNAGGGGALADLAVYHRELILISLIVYSVSMFLLALQQMIRFTIVIGLIPQKLKTVCDELDDPGPEKIQVGIFLKAMKRYSFGLRSLYFLVLIIIWFINTYAFIVGSIALTVFLILKQSPTISSFEET